MLLPLLVAHGVMLLAAALRAPLVPLSHPTPVYLLVYCLSQATCVLSVAIMAWQLWRRKCTHAALADRLTALTALVVPLSNLTGHLFIAGFDQRKSYVAFMCYQQVIGKAAMRNPPAFSLVQLALQTPWFV
jgi:hypothetical protein